MVTSRSRGRHGQLSVSRATTVDPQQSGALKRSSLGRRAGNLVADRDRAAREDVGSQATAMDERTQQAWSRQLFEVRARFGKSAPDAFNGSYPELASYKCV